MKKLFVVDDETDVLTSIKSWGEKKGLAVSTYENSEDFLNNLLEEEPEAILIDINLKGDDGRYVSEDLKNILPYPIKVVLISADEQALAGYKTHHADAILHKPFSFTALEKILHQLTD
jgi:CheY-like chemotaxis protein